MLFQRSLVNLYTYEQIKLLLRRKQKWAERLLSEKLVLINFKQRSLLLKSVNAPQSLSRFLFLWLYVTDLFDSYGPNLLLILELSSRTFQSRDCGCSRSAFHVQSDYADWSKQTLAQCVSRRCCDHISAMVGASRSSTHLVASLMIEDCRGMAWTGQSKRWLCSYILRLDSQPLRPNSRR